MEKNSITKLFEDVALYEQKSFNLYTSIDDKYSIIKFDDLKQIYDYLGLLKRNDNLITDCFECGGRFPFSLKLRRNDYDYYDRNIYLGYYNHQLANGEKHKIGIYLDFSENCKNIEEYKLEKESIKDCDCYLDYYFFCSNDENHMCKMSIYLKKQGFKIYITKIGQFPESTILGNYQCDKYKNILRRINDSYLDYRNAEKSYRFNLYSGAYCYLRRVYENMINYYLRKSGNYETLKNSKSEDKIKAVSNMFDEKIRALLYPLYQVLSCGIHIMTEDACKENYNDLKVVLDIQLQYIKSNDELEEVVNASKNVLTSLVKKYKN